MPNDRTDLTFCSSRFDCAKFDRLLKNLGNLGLNINYGSLYKIACFDGNDGISGFVGIWDKLVFSGSLSCVLRATSTTHIRVERGLK